MTTTAPITSTTQKTTDTLPTTEHKPTLSSIATDHPVTVATTSMITPMVETTVWTTLQSITEQPISPSTASSEALLAASVTESVPPTDVTTLVDALSTTSSSFELVVTETLRAPPSNDLRTFLSSMSALGSQIFERKHLLKILSLPAPHTNTQQPPAELPIMGDRQGTQVSADTTDTTTLITSTFVDIPASEILSRKSLLKILNVTRS